jgi:hypothetical protein
LMELASADVRTASAERRMQLQAIQAHVQFNFRITLSQKAQIVRRARSVGMSTRQFMLNQCLAAPIWSGPVESSLSDEQFQKLWENTASARKPESSKG